MARMKLIKLSAQKRRAALLAELIELDCTISELAEIHKMTRARMSQLIIKAKAEAKNG